MLNIGKYAALTLTTALVAGALTSSAHAQANCTVYGKLAVQQAKLNAKFKCGNDGPDWVTNFKSHVAWCGGVGPAQWKAKLQERQKKLDACGAK